MSSTLQDNYVGRLIWTLTDKTGNAAKHFADLNPPPSLDWLKPLKEHRFNHDDLKLFSVEPNAIRDDTLRFSFTLRPAPYLLAAPMALIPNANSATSTFDDPMFHIARWLLRHLDDPQLILQIANLGSFLHPKFKWLIQNHFDRIDKLKLKENKDSLRKFEEDSPKAIPRDWLRVLWDLLLANRIKMASSGNDLYEWLRRYNRTGALTAALRLELRDTLQLKLQLEEVYEDPDAIRTKLILPTTHVPVQFYNADNQLREQLVENLLDDFEQLLRDGLDLLQACSIEDQSSWDMPSIEPHWQNRRFNDWILLIELLRDSWLALLDETCQKHLKKQWNGLTYRTLLLNGWLYTQLVNLVASKAKFGSIGLRSQIINGFGALVLKEKFHAFW